MRTSYSDVTNTFDTELDQSQVEDWIEVASDFVDDIQDADQTVSSGRLERIERVLSQHFCAVQDRRIESGVIGDAEVNYAGQTGMDLQSTRYGQTALMMDPTNVLSNTQQPSATVSVLDGRNIDS